MNTWVRVGAKCVCVNKLGWVSWDKSTVELGPVFNEQCSISAVRHHAECGLVIDLAGYQAGSDYLASCFRPLVSLEDDVALFTSMRPGIDLIAERLDEFTR